MSHTVSDRRDASVGHVVYDDDVLGTSTGHNPLRKPLRTGVLTKQRLEGRVAASRCWSLAMSASDTTMQAVATSLGVSKKQVSRWGDSTSPQLPSPGDLVALADAGHRDLVTYYLGNLQCLAGAREPSLRAREKALLARAESFVSVLQTFVRSGQLRAGRSAGFRSQRESQGPERWAPLGRCNDEDDCSQHNDVCRENRHASLHLWFLAGRVGVVSWGKLDDRLHSHRKVHAAGAEAMGLWVVAYSWCCGYETDGGIPADSVRSLCALLGVSDDWRMVAARLVAAGLWVEAADGYVMHDYLDYNPSSKSLKEKRKRDASRKKDSKGNPRGVPTESRSPVPVPVPVPQETLPSVESTPDPLPPDEPVAEEKPVGKGKRIESSHARYARHYSAGISSVTGQPHSVPTRCRGELAELVTEFAKGLKLEALDQWLHDNAAAYAKATQDAPHFEAGYSIKRFTDWLNAGKRTSRSTPAAKAQTYHGMPVQRDDTDFSGWDEVAAEEQARWESIHGKGRMPGAAE